MADECCYVVDEYREGKEDFSIEFSFEHVTFSRVMNQHDGACVLSPDVFELHPNVFQAPALIGFFSSQQYKELTRENFPLVEKISTVITRDYHASVIKAVETQSSQQGVDFLLGEVVKNYNTHPEETLKSFKPRFYFCY